MSTLRTIRIADIDASNPTRTVNPAWAKTIAEEATQATLPPIEVVEVGDGTYRLVTGNHRLAAAKERGETEIAARIWASSAFQTEDELRLKQVQENLLRYELTELDRARDILTWKRIYEASKPVPKRGRPRQQEVAENGADSALIFAERFSSAAATALGISERSVKVAIQIATGISESTRERISSHDLAGAQSELMLLAAQSEDRQTRIVNLMLSEPPEATRVADAIAVLDKVQPPPRLAAVAKLSERFSRLKEADQHVFFAAHADAIERWVAGRRG